MSLYHEVTFLNPPIINNLWAKIKYYENEIYISDWIVFDLISQLFPNKV